MSVATSSSCVRPVTAHGDSFPAAPVQESSSGRFSKPERKWAISHLIDRETISRVISRPASKRANYPWADDNGWKNWAPEGMVSKYDFSFDPDKANALLDQMGSIREGDVRSLTRSMESRFRGP